MKDFLGFLLLLLLVVFLFHLTKKVELEEKRKRLIKEREFRVKDTLEKEKISAILKRRFKLILFPGYTILIAAFLLTSCITTHLLFSELKIENIFMGAAVTETLLMVTALYIYQNTYEFKHILNQFSPFLRKRIYGKNINIDSEIEINYKRIEEIDFELKKLDSI